MAVKRNPKTERWELEFMIKGKRYHRSIPEATNKREAERAEAVFKGELLQGRYNLADGKKYPRLSQLIKDYLEYSEHNKVSYKLDKYATNLFLQVVGDRPINEITPKVIEKWKKHRLESKVKSTTKDGFKELDRLLSPSSVNREIRSLSKMFSLAVDNDTLDYNPFFKVKKLREENLQMRVLTKEEEKVLFMACEDLYIKPMLLCALHTGMRSSEIKQLKWKHVNFNAGYIDVLKTKSGKPRQIPLSESLHTELSKIEHLSEYVFTNPQTLKPYKNIRDRFVDLCQAKGISSIRLHDLRHTAATRMVASNIDIVVVQELLGHSSLLVTQKYAHPVPARKAEAIKALNSYSENNDSVA